MYVTTWNPDLCNSHCTCLFRERAPEIEPEAPSIPPKVFQWSIEKVPEILNNRGTDAIEFLIPDVIEALADLANTSRTCMIERSLMLWFQLAGYTVESNEVVTVEAVEDKKWVKFKCKIQAVFDRDLQAREYQTQILDNLVQKLPKSLRNKPGAVAVPESVEVLSIESVTEGCVECLGRAGVAALIVFMIADTRAHARTEPHPNEALRILEEEAGGELSWNPNGSGSWLVPANHAHHGACRFPAAMCRTCANVLDFIGR